MMASGERCTCDYDINPIQGGEKLGRGVAKCTSALTSPGNFIMTFMPTPQQDNKYQITVFMYFDIKP